METSAMRVDAWAYAGQHYYDIKKAVEEESVEGLLGKSRQSPRLGLRIPSTVEDAILAYPRTATSASPASLRRRGIVVSAGGVRCVWIRHELTKRRDWLRRLETYAAAEGAVLTDSQRQALESSRVERHTYGGTCCRTNDDILDTLIATFLDNCHGFASSTLCLRCRNPANDCVRSLLP